MLVRYSTRKNKSNNKNHRYNPTKNRPFIKKIQKNINGLKLKFLKKMEKKIIKNNTCKQD